MGFLKIILIFLLVYFALKFIFRLAAPYLMRYLFKKAGQKMNRAFNPDYHQEKKSSKQKEGKITVDKVPERKKRNKKPVGEYVDYEEID